MNKYIDFMLNLTVYLDSKAMNYPRSQLSKHSHHFLMTYGYCSICTTCAISGTSGITIYKYSEIIRNLYNKFESLFCVEI